MRDDLQVAIGNSPLHTVKALEGAEAGKVGGYLIVFGSPMRKDLQGEWFSQRTNLVLDSFPIKGAMTLYHHGLDQTLSVKRIGTITDMKRDEVGVWAEAQLDLRDAYQRKIYDLVQKGVLGWSSGALPQSVVVDRKSGEILQWGVIEGSLTPAPAFPDIPGAENSTAIMPLKAMLDQPLSEDFKLQEGNKTMDALAMVQAMAQALGLSLSEEQVQAAVAALQGQVPAEETAMQAALADPQKAQELAASVAKAVMAQSNTMKFGDAARQFAGALVPESRAGNVTQQGQQSRITDVQDRRYDGLKAEDLIFGAHMMAAANKHIDEKWLRAAYDKVERQFPYDNNAYGRDAALKADLPVKADEIVATNLSGNGQNWVGAAYLTQLWEAARIPVVYQELKGKGLNEVEIPKGMASMTIPAEGSDPVFYTMAELNDITTDEFLPVTPKPTPTINPGKRTLTPTGVGARVAFSDFMDEDSLIPVLPFLRSRMELAAQEAVEYMLINGDTVVSASTNLNLIDGTPSVDSKGRGPRYLAFDGFLKLPIITTVAQARDGGALTEDDYLATYNLLPANEVDEDRLVFIVDVRTMVATRNLPALKTRDVFSNATLEGGKVTGLYGVSLLKSGQMGLANAAGKISGTPSNNTKGRILCVRPDRWYLGRKREITTEVARDIDAQATVVVSTMRLGLQSFAATGAAAATYNLTV